MYNDTVHCQGLIIYLVKDDIELPPCIDSSVHVLWHHLWLYFIVCFAVGACLWRLSMGRIAGACPLMMPGNPWMCHLLVQKVSSYKQLCPVMTKAKPWFRLWGCVGSPGRPLQSLFIFLFIQSVFAASSLYQQGQSPIFSLRIRDARFVKVFVKLLTGHLSLKRFWCLFVSREIMMFVCLQKDAKEDK